MTAARCLSSREGREGFILPKSLTASPSQAKLLINIRDHSKAGYEAKKALLKQAVEYLKVRHPRAVISYTQEDVYSNIADAVTPEKRSCIDLLYKALEEVGVKAKTIAMRGGTDGSYISTQGIPTPNYFTGAHNFHSVCEFMPMSSWVKSLEVTLKLVELTAKA